MSRNKIRLGMPGIDVGYKPRKNGDRHPNMDRWEKEANLVREITGIKQKMADGTRNTINQLEANRVASGGKPIV